MNNNPTIAKRWRHVFSSIKVERKKSPIICYISAFRIIEYEPLQRSIKWNRAKANRVSSREQTGHSKHYFQQLKRRLYTWTSPDGQHQNQIDYILYSQRWRSSIQSTKTRPRTDCDSDHELLIAKFRLKLKKVGKTTRPVRYDLNQIPYDYTVEVRNRFKGLDLTEYQKNYGQRLMPLYRRQ